MSGYKLHKYGDEVIRRNVNINPDRTTFTNVSSRILTKNAIAIKPYHYRSVEFSDDVYVLSLPMSADEKAKIYRVEDPNAYIDWKANGSERRLYPISKLKLVKEINQPAVNKKLYNMSFSSYKK